MDSQYNACNLLEKVLKGNFHRQVKISWSLEAVPQFAMPQTVCTQLQEPLSAVSFDF